MITEQKARHHPVTLPILGPEDLELTTSSYPLCSNKKNKKAEKKKRRRKPENSRIIVTEIKVFEF